MANTTIQIKSSGTALSIPSAGALASGELALNYADEKLYFKNSAGTVKFFSTTGGAGTPGGANKEIQFNDSGSFGGNAAFTFDKTNTIVSVANTKIANNYVNTNIVVIKSSTTSNTGTLQYNSGLNSIDFIFA